MASQVGIGGTHGLPSSHDRPERQRLIQVLYGLIALTPLNSQLVNQPVQIAARDPQRSGAFRFAPPALAQSSQNQSALKAADLFLIRSRKPRRFTSVSRRGAVSSRSDACRQLPPLHA